MDSERERGRSTASNRPAGPYISGALCEQTGGECQVFPHIPGASLWLIQLQGLFVEYVRRKEGLIKTPEPAVVIGIQQNEDLRVQIQQVDQG